jgi:transcriptional regulator with XRE-family HTH domain
VDRTNDISEFLTSRRAKVTPEQAGLPSYGRRRVSGLRREEVASLAGVSVEYYKRLERGNLSGVSDMVLEALARALQLDDAERAHLFDLARAAGPAMTTRRRPSQQRIRPSVQRFLDALNAPAYVRNNRRDILAANALGQALYSEMYRDPVRPVNVARFIFLNPRVQDSFSTGTASPTTPWRACVSRLAARPSTVACRTSSVSCRPAARSSAPGRRRTTCASTEPASSASTTRSWASLT